MIDNDPDYPGMDNGIVYEVVVRIDSLVVTATVGSVSEGLAPAEVTSILDQAIAVFTVG